MTDKTLFFVCSQAFLEMADENAAATMVTYYASGIAQLRGRAVYVQFSNHRELKTDQTHSNNAVSSPTNDVANTSEVCVILLASLLSRFTNLGRGWGGGGKTQGVIFGYSCMREPPTPRQINFQPFPNASSLSSSFSRARRCI